MNNNLNQDKGHQIELRLGGFCIFLASDILANLQIYNSYKPFTCKKKAPHKADISVITHYSFPPSKFEKISFETDDWTLFEDGEKLIIKDSFRLMILDSDLSNGNVYLKRNSPIGLHYYPLQHPFDKILLLSLLLKNGEGSIIHSCGVSYREYGLLFVGASGAGKSTLAKIFNKSAEKEGGSRVIILNDDRIIVRKEHNKTLIYGTPWHGDAALYSNKSTPLKKIFFLKHGTKNLVTPINPIQAISLLISRSFPPCWDMKGTQNLINLFAEITQTIPCYELSFVPDESAVNFVLNFTS